MRKPAALRPGDTIGIVAPSGPVPPDDLQTGVSILEARGYRVSVGRHVLDKAGHCAYLAGTDTDRAADLQTMLTRPDITAVLCARGGYGAMRILDRLDWQAIAKATPKLFCGYSDITSLHLALARQVGWATLYGPNATSLPKLNATALTSFWNLLESSSPSGVCPATPDALQTIVPGTAAGELAGGCLCLLAHSLGSRFAPDFRGKIVLIEDVGEAVYRIDRDLIQLQNAGAFDDVAGFVLGTVTGWEKHEADPPRSTLDALWQDFFVPLNKPTITDFPFGHEPNPLTLPLGASARLDATARTLTLLELAATSE